uniref:PSI domain-containing protein n=1 Tax=Spongospora subterranea TaxID=70186 RepID=A0A0H5RN51_9EUKA|eukprot:CRZ10169.1 hypothetical protein [Spongospora subterranea]
MAIRQGVFLAVIAVTLGVGVSHNLTEVASNLPCHLEDDCKSCTSLSGCKWSRSSSTCLLASESLVGLYIYDPEDCKCNSDAEPTCNSCTSSLGCVYIKQGEVQITAFQKVVSVVEFEEDENGKGGYCLEGSPLRNRQKNFDYSFMTFSIVPHTWCWGQCLINGVWFVLIVMALLLMLLITFVMIIFKYCKCRRDRGMDYVILHGGS